MKNIIRWPNKTGNDTIFYFKKRVPGKLPTFFGTHRVGFMYAEKGGGPVLKEEVKWHKISGVYFNTPWGYGYLMFRRWGS